jgi:cadmium resistance protein CadD (predicted permease)
MYAGYWRELTLMCAVLSTALALACCAGICVCAKECLHQVPAVVQLLVFEVRHLFLQQQSSSLCTLPHLPAYMSMYSDNIIETVYIDYEDYILLDDACVVVAPAVSATCTHRCMR